MQGHSITYLYIYIIAWAVTLFVAFKRSKTISIGKFLVFEYLFCSICSYLTFTDPYCPESYKPLKLFPFIYLYVFTLITTLPALRYDRYEINRIETPSQNKINLIIWPFIIASLLSIPQMISSLQTNLVAILMGYGNDLYMDSYANSSSEGTSIENLPAVIANLLYSPAAVTAFYYLSLEQSKKARRITLLLFLCISIRMISASLTGQRGGVIRELFVLGALYMIFYRFYSSKLRRRFNTIIIVVVALLAVPFIAITISRFEMRKGGSISSLLDYSGQSSLYFNNYALDDNGIRYGDRVMPGVKLLLGYDNVPMNWVQRRAKYPNLYLGDEYFSSYIGDFAIDFGPFFGGVLLIIFTMMFMSSLRIRGGVIRYHQLLILGVIAAIIPEGYFKLFPFSEVIGNISLLVRIVIIFWFKNSLPQPSCNKQIV